MEHAEREKEREGEGKQLKSPPPPLHTALNPHKKIPSGERFQVEKGGGGLEG